MNFKLWNRWTGWIVFAIAAMTYLLTMEPTPSLWDCSEFIATSYKLEVGHPPGAPLFMLMARIASIFAPSPYYVPHMVNGMNALASAFCILFLFWSITHIARRIITLSGRQMGTSSNIATLGAGVVGALAYTFTDTFWFSAVEGEVYALSSMFTALVVWLMLKWEEHADEPGANRWILLIAYLMGLSIGVHILNLLTIPALVFIYYFRKFSFKGMANFIGFIAAGIVSLLILGFINGIIIPYTVYLGAMVDVWFVNTLGAPVNSGIVVYALLLFVALFAAIYYTHIKGRAILNFALLCLTMILIGFSSYATVTIRAAANPPMNSNNPDNPHALLSLLNRDQYGNRPLLYGPQFTAPAIDVKTEMAYSYNPETERYDQVEKLVDYEYPSDLMHFFPRMWHFGKANEYKVWGAYRTDEQLVVDEYGQPILDANNNRQYETVQIFGETVDNPLFDPYYEENEHNQRYIVEPTTAENLYYFFNYQLNYMYWRYFLWNFVGRQDDIQAGSETLLHGNWLSGLNWADESRLGPQENLPSEVANNPARNTYYFLPFLLGLIGLFYHLIRDERYFFVVMCLFIMMGVALVVYFNTCPSEPRERDYVYAGSFYAFCIWIGLGVMALWELMCSLFNNRFAKHTAIAATVLGMSVPTILAVENWDDHDRSGRTYVRDIGWNYLMSTPENAIIINYGDNDTFPLWYVQEVEGVRPDVRIMNSSYLSGDWYIDEMKCAANDAAGVPFSLPRSKYVGDVNNQLYIIPQGDEYWDLKEAIEFVKSDEEYTKYNFGNEQEPDLLDYLPTDTFTLPVNKDNAIAAGIVEEKDRDLILDQITFTINKRYILKSEMMILDLLANFDWKRPLCFTQVYILNDLGLIDYLQFDGMSYRLVPIKTKYTSAWHIGRIDTDYVYPMLMETFRYGNLADEDVLVDHFTSYNLAASKARESFARLAQQLIIEGKEEKATKVLERGMQVFPNSKIRFSDANTLPFIEAYYMLGDYVKGDELLKSYAENLSEYLRYYNSFPEELFSMIQEEVNDRMNSLDNLLYNIAIKFERDNMVDMLLQMYKSNSFDDIDSINRHIIDSYYYYSQFQQGDEWCINIINDNVAIIEEFFKLPEDKILTKQQEDKIVNAMFILEDMYILSKDYTRQQITEYLHDYLLSIGYDEDNLSQL